MTPLRPLDSARQWLDSTRQAIMTGHGWTTGLGDCCLDFTSCLSVVACAPAVVGQLAQRVFNKKYLCAIITATLWIGTLASFFFYWYTPKCEAHDYDTVAEYYDAVDDYYSCYDEYYTSPFYYVAATLSVLATVSTCVITMIVRQHVRERDRIPVTMCSGLDDCFCSCICAHGAGSNCNPSASSNTSTFHS